MNDARTIYEKMERVDFRRHRAMHLTAALMQELDEVLDGLNGSGIRREIQERLFAALERNGAYVMTDEDRAKAGLEPRDGRGWTPSELIAERQAYQDALMRISGVTLEKPAQWAKEPSHD
jgi:hypothetical protein